MMRFAVYEQIWHGFGFLYRHLLLMMDFDYPLAFCHKKGEYFLEFLHFWSCSCTCFCSQGGSLFLLVGACGVALDCI